MSAPFQHTVTGSGPAAGREFSGRTNGVTPSAGVPIVIALHGGTYSSAYFDIEGFSLLERGVAPGICVIALDRPNYGQSTPLEADEHTIIDENATICNDAIASIWRELGGESAGIVLVAHSIGGAVATTIAAQENDWPLLGLATSGCLVRVPQESRAAWESLPDLEMIDLQPPMKDQFMFGPPETRGEGMPEASYPSNTLVPKAELLDITGGWIERRAEVCAKVNVPVQHRQAVFDALWVTDQAQLDEYVAGFTAAPTIDGRLQLHSGHCIDFHIPSGAFQSSQLGFALECANWTDTEGH